MSTYLVTSTIHHCPKNKNKTSSFQVKTSIFTKVIKDTVICTEARVDQKPNCLNSAKKTISFSDKRQICTIQANHATCKQSKHTKQLNMHYLI